MGIQYVADVCLKGYYLSRVPYKLFRNMTFSVCYCSYFCSLTSTCETSWDFSTVRFEWNFAVFYCIFFGILCWWCWAFFRGQISSRAIFLGTIFGGVEGIFSGDNFLEQDSQFIIFYFKIGTPIYCMAWNIRRSQIILGVNSALKVYTLKDPCKFTFFVFLFTFEFLCLLVLVFPCPLLL